MGNRQHRPTPTRWPALGHGESVVLSVRPQDRDRVSALLPYISYGPAYLRGVLDALRAYSKFAGDGAGKYADVKLAEAEQAAGIGQEVKTGMKTYRGTRWGLGDTVVKVDVDGQTYDLPHVVKHSPDGFEWGYGGSGPAELARCLLLDALGAEAKCPTCHGAGKRDYDDPDGASFRGKCDDCWGSGISVVLERNYQDFKTALIAPIQDRTWSMTEDDIRAWWQANVQTTSP